LQNALDSKFHQAPLETMQAVNQLSSPEGQFNLVISPVGVKYPMIVPKYPLFVN